MLVDYLIDMRNMLCAKLKYREEFRCTSFNYHNTSTKLERSFLFSTINWQFNFNTGRPVYVTLYTQLVILDHFCCTCVNIFLSVSFSAKFQNDLYDYLHVFCLFFSCPVSLNVYPNKPFLFKSH